MPLPELRRPRVVTVVSEGALMPAPGVKGMLVVVKADRLNAPLPATGAITMRQVSGIDTTVPIFGRPTTESVRNNFQIAKDEIEDLQNSKLDLAGGTMTGPIVLVATQIIDGGSF
jgi:hypothetical protein